MRACIVWSGPTLLQAGHARVSVGPFSGNMPTWDLLNLQPACGAPSQVG